MLLLRIATRVMVMKRNAVSGLILLCGLIALMSPAGAQQSNDCSSAVVQSEINACVARSYKREDDALNAIYKRLMAKLSADDKPKLVKAERDWINRRDKTCEKQTEGSVGGSIHPMDVSLCLEDVTKARTGLLQDFEKDCAPGGDACAKATQVFLK